MRERPSSRLLVVDAQDRLLLFRFDHTSGPLAGTVFWATPGGGLDLGESYEEAACRELIEETGILVDDPGPQVARRLVTFPTPGGDTVTADERFFLIRCAGGDVSRAQWTDLEQAVMTEHRWWSADELKATKEQVWPEDLPDILAAAGVWDRSERG